MIGTNVTRGKVWGNTSTIFAKNNVEIARIEIEPGGYCSKHKHETKYNLFYVESGKLEIKIFRTDANKQIEDVTVLGPQGSTFVEPGLFHTFRAIEKTVAYEIYWTELSLDDIQRETVGGIDAKN